MLDAAPATAAIRRAGPRRRIALPGGLTSLRAQGAGLLLFLVAFGGIAIVVSTIATDRQNATYNEQVALLTWEDDTTHISLDAEVLRTHLAQFNNSLLDGDNTNASAAQTNANNDIASIDSYLTRIDALQLPSDATPVVVRYHDAAVALARFAISFMAAGMHTDEQMLTQVDGALKTWRTLSASAPPFIAADVADNKQVYAAELSFGNELTVASALAAVAVLALMSLILFRFALRPVVRLAGVAHDLAEGRSVTIAPTNRQDEIGRLTNALAAWQASAQRLVSSLSEGSAKAAASATGLSSAADQLVGATAEQTAAATETSASMEELARTSTSIAETLERVAQQVQETRDNLQQAQSDTQASGERTLALAERVGDINQILTLINEIADQTNLLALNAAIEAARAGDSGRGFAVVADEVRRLAERSKTSASKIASIIQSAQTESNATVIAMEQSAKQMQHGLSLLAAVVDASDQVKLITQQQQSATAQVVEAMEQITVGSRQVAATAQEISGAASSHAALAHEMEALSSRATQRS